MLNVELSPQNTRMSAGVGDFMLVRKYEGDKPILVRIVLVRGGYTLVDVESGLYWLYSTFDCVPSLLDVRNHYIVRIIPAEKMVLKEVE